MKKKEKNEWAELLILIAFDEHCYPSFIGRESRYLELRKEVHKLIEDKKINHRFLGNDELIYLDKETYEDSLADIIYNILRNRFHKFEIDAKIHAEMFRKFKVKDYL